MKTRHFYLMLILFTNCFISCKRDEEVTDINTVTSSISGYISNYSDNLDLIDSIYCYNDDILLDKCKVDSDGRFTISLPVTPPNYEKITSKFPSNIISDTTALINNSHTFWFFSSLGFEIKINNKESGYLTKSNGTFPYNNDYSGFLKNYSCSNFIYCDKLTKIIGLNVNEKVDDYISTSSFNLTLNKGWNEFTYTMVIDSVLDLQNISTGISIKTGKTEQTFSNTNMPSLQWRFIKTLK